MLTITKSPRQIKAYDWPITVIDSSKIQNARTKLIKILMSYLNSEELSSAEKKQLCLELKDKLIFDSVNENTNSKESLFQAGSRKPFNAEEVRNRIHTEINKYFLTNCLNKAEKESEIIQINKFIDEFCLYNDIKDIVRGLLNNIKTPEELKSLVNCLKKARMLQFIDQYSDAELNKENLTKPWQNLLHKIYDNSQLFRSDGLFADDWLNFIETEVKPAEINPASDPANLNSPEEILNEYQRENPDINLDSPSDLLRARQTLSQKITIGLKKLINSLPEPSKYWEVFREALALATYHIRIKLFGYSNNNLPQEVNADMEELTEEIMGNQKLVRDIATKEAVTNKLEQTGQAPELEKYYKPLTKQEKTELKELYLALQPRNEEDPSFQPPAQQLNKLKEYLVSLNLNSKIKELWPSSELTDETAVNIINAAKNILDRFHINRNESQHPLYKRDLQAFAICLLIETLPPLDLAPKETFDLAREIKMEILKGELEFNLYPANDYWLSQYTEMYPEVKFEIDKKLVNSLNDAEIDLCLGFIHYYILRGLMIDYDSSSKEIQQNLDLEKDKLLRMLHKLGRPSYEPLEKGFVTLTEEQAKSLEGELNAKAECLKCINFGNIDLGGQFARINYKGLDIDGKVVEAKAANETKNADNGMVPEEVQGVKFWLENPILTFFRGAGFPSHLYKGWSENNVSDEPKEKQINLRLNLKYDTTIATFYITVLPSYQEYISNKETIDKLLKDYVWDYKLPQIDNKSENGNPEEKKVELKPIKTLRICVKGKNSGRNHYALNN